MCLPKDFEVYQTIMGDLKKIYEELKTENAANTTAIEMAVKDIYQTTLTFAQSLCGKSLIPPKYIKYMNETMT